MPLSDGQASILAMDGRQRATLLTPSAHLLCSFKGDWEYAVEFISWLAESIPPMDQLCKNSPIPFNDGILRSPRKWNMWLTYQWIKHAKLVVSPDYKKWSFVRSFGVEIKIVRFEKLIKTGNRLCNFSRCPKVDISMFPTARVWAGREKNCLFSILISIAA